MEALFSPGDTGTTRGILWTYLEEKNNQNKTMFLLFTQERGSLIVGFCRFLIRLVHFPCLNLDTFVIKTHLSLKINLERINQPFPVSNSFSYLPTQRDERVTLTAVYTHNDTRYTCDTWYMTEFIKIHQIKTQSIYKLQTFNVSFPFTPVMYLWLCHNKG